MNHQAKVEQKLQVVGDGEVPAVERTEAVGAIPRLVEDRPELVAAVVQRLRAIASDERFDSLTDTDDPEYWLCRNIGTAIGEIDGLGEGEIATLLDDRLSTIWSVRFAASQALRRLAERSTLTKETYARILTVYRTDLRAWREAFQREELPAGTDGADIIDVHIPAMHQLAFALELPEHPALAKDFADDLAATRAAIPGESGDYFNDTYRQLLAIVLNDLGEVGQHALASHDGPSVQARKAAPKKAAPKKAAPKKAAPKTKAAPRARSASAKGKTAAGPSRGPVRGR